MLVTGRISPRTPQITVVSPLRTMARLGFWPPSPGWRLARRNSCGVSLAKIPRVRELDCAIVAWLPAKLHVWEERGREETRLFYPQFAPGILGCTCCGVAPAALGAHCGPHYMDHLRSLSIRNWPTG